MRKLSDISESFIGLTYKPSDIAETGTLVLRSGNIQNSQLAFEDNVRVKIPIKDKLFVRNNDILMCSRNGSAALVGKVARIQGIDEPMTFGAFMTIIRSEYHNYLFQFFQMQEFRDQIGTAKTTTINQITQKMLESVVLPVPPMDRIEAFSEILEQSDKSKFELKKAVEKVDMLIKSLMQV